MGQPSTTHERTHRSSSHHHHHRTISSTTLLLALSLILAVLAITLSIPSYSSSGTAAAVQAEVPPPPGGIWRYLTPKHAQGLVSRESAVALREYEVARREAELLAGTAVVPLIGSPCPAEVHTVRVVTETVTVEALPTATTIYKEVHKEVEPLAVPPPPWWKDERVEKLQERELKISQREKEVGTREENVGKREGDAAKREAWVMEQLINIGQDKIVEEEVVYETPGRRKPKPIDIPAFTTEYISTRTVTVSEPDPVEPIPTVHTTTVTVAMPSSTRLAAYPAPEALETPDVTTIGRTTEIQVIVEATTTVTPAQTGSVTIVEAVEDEDEYDEEYEDDEEPTTVRTVRRVAKPGRRNFKKWFE